MKQDERRIVHFIEVFTFACHYTKLTFAIHNENVIKKDGVLLWIQYRKS